MNFVAGAALTAAVVNAILAGFVFFTNPRSRLNRVYALWGGSVATWNLAAYFKSFPHVGKAEAFVWVGIIQSAVVFLPLTLAHLCQHVLKGRPAYWLRWVYALHIALVGCILFTPYYMRDVQHVAGLGWWSVGGPLFKVYLASFAFLTLPLLVGMPLIAWRAPQGRKAQIFTLWLAILTLWVCGINDMMPILGKTTYFGTGIPFVPLGNFGAIFYGVAVAYSVLQHQLLDINYAFSRAAALTVRLSFIATISLLIILIARAVRPESFDGFEIGAALAAVGISGLIAAIIFPKLLGGATAKIERAFMGDRFELPDKVGAFIEQMKWQLDLEKVLDELTKFLSATFRLRVFSVVLVGETKHGFTVVRAAPEKPATPLLPAVQSDGPIFTKPGDESRGDYIVLDEGDAGADGILSAIRSELGGLPGRVIFPFRIEDRALGFLLVGEKQNGRNITSQEAQLLSQIARNISLVVNQITLRNQMMRSQELDLIGRMSAGIAHDLRNLSTPISTLLQLLEERIIPIEDIRTELVPVARRNLQQMRAYMNEALFFSENLNFDFQETRLDTLLENAVRDAQVQRRKNREIRYELESSGEVSARADGVHLSRLIGNLIANAVDASPEGAAIRLSLARIEDADGLEWFRIQVADSGCGIPPENLGKIFEPYFSTKKTGDADRGFGLGLAICQRIATIHRGSLTVASSTGIGTTFTLDLPGRRDDDAVTRETRREDRAA